MTLTKMLPLSALLIALGNFTHTSFAAADAPHDDEEAPDVRPVAPHAVHDAGHVEEFDHEPGFMAPAAHQQRQVVAARHRPAQIAEIFSKRGNMSRQD